MALNPSTAENNAKPIAIKMAFLTFEISPEEIRFGPDSLRTKDVTGIRYGILKKYVNGVVSSRSYEICLTDETHILRVECASGLFITGKTIERRFRDAITALYPIVQVPLTQKMLCEIQSGRGTVVGDILFDLQGLHRQGSMNIFHKGLTDAWSAVAGGKTAEDRQNDYKHLHWKDYWGHNIENGVLVLYKKRPNPPIFAKDKKSWAELNLRNTWNAVCLDLVLRQLYKDGSC